MRLIAGVDIGNSTTEVCIGQRSDDGRVTFLASALRPTTGTKGTLPNVHGIKAALKAAVSAAGRDISELSVIRINEAAPVIGDTAMETITETINKSGYNVKENVKIVSALYDGKTRV